MIDIIKNYSNKYNLNVKEEALILIEKYYDLLMQYQSERNINLCGITEPVDFALKNIIDTFLLNINIPAGAVNIIDMGTGNGIPGLIIAVLNPEKKIMLVDSTKKKIEFVEFIIKTLNLKNCLTAVERLETLPLRKQYFEKFDAAIGRALASLEQFAELATPFLKLNGLMIVQKSRKIEEELTEAEKMLEFCGFKLAAENKYNIEDNYRIIMNYKKTKITPKIFPRRIGEYKKKSDKYL